MRWMLHGEVGAVCVVEKIYEIKYQQYARQIN